MIWPQGYLNLFLDVFSVAEFFKLISKNSFGAQVFFSVI